MNKIKILPPSLIAKIAAGEVIERPAFAVKELVENSIDAGATSINIELEKAGLQKIIVKDNGSGMSKEDLELAWQHHATSKLKNEDDLLKIKTLGFRGEALGSLAAISDLTLQSRAAGSLPGFSVSLSDGKVVKKQTIGMPKGTIATVTNLFAHIPARQKFLHSQESELRYVTQQVIAAALAYPNVAFTLSHNKKVLFSLPPKQPIKQRVAEVLGNELTNGLFPISLRSPYLQVHGFLSHPQLATTSSTRSLLFVNGRFVKHKGVSTLIKQLYGKLLAPQSQPVFILYLTTPVEMVDVNIHPRKEEVSFAHETEIRDNLSEAVIKTLEKNSLRYRSNLNVDWGTNTIAAKELKRTVLRPLSDEVFSLHNLYLLLESKDGLLFVDQHAAHERILYENLVKGLKKRRVKVFKPPRPINLSLSPVENQLMNEFSDKLAKAGFQIKNHKLISYPTILEDRNLGQIIKNALADIEEFGEVNLDPYTDKMLSYLACRSAIKSGDKLTDIQKKKLIKDLQQTKTNYTCPHGRPVQFEVMLKDLSKLFRR